MRKLFILKTGTSHPHIIARYGDFVDWFIDGLQVPAERLAVIDSCNGDELPDYSKVLGVLITGSHAMVTERLPWSERIAQWLPGAIEQGFPILGVCYGHQLLAQALGGRVDYNPLGGEYGTSAIHLNTNGEADPLLGGLGNPILAQVAHFQSVTQLPPSAQLLATSSMDAHQAFCINGCIWGVQFHPEISAPVVREYIHYNREKLGQSGQDPEQSLNSVVDTPLGAEILRRFGSLCMTDK